MVGHDSSVSRLGYFTIMSQTNKVGLFLERGQCWSALATAPAETSAEAKEAFNFNKILPSTNTI